ncbi:hypothetical protein CYLTODRAFT_426626 [Cylindrobasidium torrendii FP15055 ss-10]|uniref:EamA domain-containing protein n=1 Tax=Cylindrobasidium torrendii FP15055 ss-10 TaxID=1314674 RepID=A0A0D7AXX1_9AGAR|nr:hypothetical protein CYLTODRAFT_426626 [Cylindrobasidium torrendii FP15055 ss-10]
MSLSYVPLAGDEEGIARRSRTAWISRLSSTCASRIGKASRSLKKIPTLQTYGGLLLIVLAQAFFALMNVAVKTLNGIDPPVHTLQLIVVRMGITYVFSVLYMLATRVNDPWIGPPGVRLLLWFRGFSGFFGLFGIYFSLAYLSLSDATVLTFLAPFLTGIAGAVFLKEGYSVKEGVAGVCSLFGVILIARPAALFGFMANEPDVLSVDASPSADELDAMNGLEGAGVTQEQRLIAVGVALLGVVGATGAYTSIRAIGTRAHALHSLASFSLQSTIVAAIGMLVLRIPVVIPTRITWGLLLLEIGVFGFAAQFLLTLGLQREPAGRGTMAIYTQVVFATVAERVVFGTRPDGISVLGACIIVGCAGWGGYTRSQNRSSSSLSSEEAKAEDIALEEGLLRADDKMDDGLEWENDLEMDGDDRNVREDAGPSTPTSPVEIENR